MDPQHMDERLLKPSEVGEALGKRSQTTKGHAQTVTATQVERIAAALPNAIRRLPMVMARTGLSATTIWRMERRGEFPKRLRLSANAVGWREEELKAWIDARDRGVRPQHATSGEEG